MKRTAAFIRNSIPGNHSKKINLQPKKLEAPVGRPLIIRFVPRDGKTHPIVFSKGLKEETGLELQDLIVSNGQPADTPSMVIRSYGKGFDIYCREHRGVAGFGTIVTPSK